MGAGLVEGEVVGGMPDPYAGVVGLGGIMFIMVIM
jgi:hypothetical protein